jgi:hypothetical protein
MQLLWALEHFCCLPEHFNLRKLDATNSHRTKTLGSSRLQPEVELSDRNCSISDDGVELAQTIGIPREFRGISCVFVFTSQATDQSFHLLETKNY